MKIIIVIECEGDLKGRLIIFLLGYIATWVSMVALSIL